MLPGLCGNGRDDAEGCASHLQNLLQLEQDHGSPKEVRLLPLSPFSLTVANPQQLTRLTNLLLPFSPIYELLLRLPRLGDTSAPTSEAESYTPWTPPTFPAPPTIHKLPLPSAPASSTFQFLPPAAYPRPFPRVRQVVHHPETGMALLLSNTLGEEVEERQGEEREVQVRRKRLGAGGEKEVRRAVGRDVLVASKVGLFGSFRAVGAARLILVRRW